MVSCTKAFQFLGKNWWVKIFHIRPNNSVPNYLNKLLRHAAKYRI